MFGMYRKAALVAAALLIAFAACVDEAPTVQPPGEEIIVDPNPPGDEYLHVEGIYPEDPNPSILIFADAPVDTDLIILFSKPVNTATITSANIQIAPATPSFNVTYFAGDAVSGYKGVRIDLTNGGANPLLFTTTYSVTVNKNTVTGVLATDGNYLYQGDTYQYQFTTGTDTSADLDPRVIAVTRSPTPLAIGICCVLPYVEVTFSKDMDDVTVTPASFQVIDNSVPLNITASITNVDNNNRTFQAVIPALSYNQSYTVNLTAAITDGSNPLVLDGNHTWSFTTEVDPFPGGAVTIDSVWVTDVTDTSATINWTTNLPVSGSTVDYGTDSSYGDPLSPGIEAAGSYTVHSVTISLTAPSNATKFYYRINSGGTISTSSFITEDTIGGSNDDPVSITAGDKSELVIEQRNNLFNFDGSSFALWIDGSGDVYAQYFDTANPPNPLWGANGSPVDSNFNKSNVRVFTDFLGRLIVTAENGGNIYAKRVYHSGGLQFDVNWGTAADDDTDDGILIGSGTNPSAVLIWGAQGNNNVDIGFVTSVYTNDTEMSIPTNPFYDFSVNLISTTSTGDILYRSTNNQTTVIDTSNFRHVMGQSSVIIAPGNSYMIGDASNTTTFNPTNHSMHSGTSYSNSGQLTYTQHGWPWWADLNAGDILTQAGDYASIDAITTISVSPIDSGTESTWQRLIDVSANFTGAGVAAGDWVTDGSNWAQVSNVISSIELALDSNIISWGENYVIYENAPIDTGTAEVYSASQLVDTIGPHSNWTSTVADGDLAWNSTTSNYTTVNGAPPDDDTLNLNADIYSAGDGYEIYKRVASGTARRTNRVVDVGASWTSSPSINLDDLVWRTDNSTWGFVLQVVNNRILRLDWNVFTSTGGNRGYEIYRNYCDTHDLSAPIDDFYEIDVNWNINISTAAGAVTIYNRIKSGTADTPPSNPLYDNDADFLSITAPLPVIADDWVYNTTDDTVARVRTAPFAVSTRALDLTANIMTDGDFFTVLRFLNPFEPMLQIGSSTATSANRLIDGSANFTGNGVVAGDLVYNVTDDTYATVANVDSGTQLTLNKDVFTVSENYIVFSSDEPLIEAGIVTNDPGGFLFDDASADFNSVNSPVQVGDVVHNNTTGQDGYVTAINSATRLTLNADIMSLGDRYVIMQPRILFAYESGGDIYGRVIRLRDGSDYQGLGVIDICTAAGTQSNVHVVERGFRGSFNGGAFVVYESSDGDIYAKLVDGDGIVPGGTGLGTSIGTGTIIDVISESWDMFYVLYRSGTDIYLRSINNALGVNWTRTFANAEDAAMMLSPSYYITVAYSMGSQVFVQQFDWNNTVTMAASTVVGVVPYAYYSDLSITASPGTNGAIVSWIDERYFASLGFVVMAQAVDAAGTRLWNANPAGADYDGILIGIPGTWETADVSLKTLFYNDAASPWGGLFIWFDYRNGIADIYYDTKSN